MKKCREKGRLKKPAKIKLPYRKDGMLNLDISLFMNINHIKSFKDLKRYDLSKCTSDEKYFLNEAENIFLNKHIDDIISDFNEAQIIKIRNLMNQKLITSIFR